MTTDPEGNRQARGPNGADSQGPCPNSASSPQNVEALLQARCLVCASSLFLANLRRMLYQLQAFDWEMERESVYEPRTLQNFKRWLLRILGEFYEATKAPFPDEEDWAAFQEVADAVAADVKKLSEDIGRALAPPESNVENCEDRTDEIGDICRAALESARDVAAGARANFVNHERRLSECCQWATENLDSVTRGGPH